ncbi:MULTISPECIES: hypothetical protein [Haloarcula]|uniref:hypothetical protein n=1 Tax=Haloarcula TaxID=2237 RepID=UPI0023EDACD9|nr:hypothetical protein [Halomicroarcula sp. XH51]
MTATDHRAAVEARRAPVPESDDDRYCRHCEAIGLAYDPTAGRARCRSCGSLV